MILFFTLIATTGLCQDDQAAPPAARPNLFGIQQGNQTEVFVASDVSEETEQAVKETLAAAVDAWGSTGRLEYWVLGPDREAALELSEKFCKRRVARGDMTMRECMRDRFNKDHGFLSYQKIGADAVATGRPSMSAGHNGGSEWGFHRYSSSIPLGFAGLLEIAAEGDQLTIFSRVLALRSTSFNQSGRSSNPPQTDGASLVCRRIGRGHGGDHDRASVGRGQTEKMEQRGSSLAKFGTKNDE